ncbi:unnamed protein product [Rotaria sp. Silwood2]|nr:unnamed protein product [Rotaria sp. Silwood2]CAF2878646.1 unnamed protein product [Rotaria sp. Silwood2]
MTTNTNLNTKTEDETTALNNKEALLQIDSNGSLTIEKKLRVEDFRLLRERFDRATIHNFETNTKPNDKTTSSLNKEEFIESFESILDLAQYRNQLEKLFDKLNSKETGFINWNDFCTYMLQFYQDEDYANTLRISPFNNEPKIRHVAHNKQELTAKILHLENPVRFINISKEGSLGLWTPNLNLEKIYSTIDELDDGSSGGNTSGTGQNRRRAGMWITDAIFMPDVHKLVLASTSRDLRFFTITTEAFLEDFVLFGLKNVPTCLEYNPTPTGGNNESALIYGDDSGFIHILYFKNPINSLFDPVRRKTDPGKFDRMSANPTQRIFWDELKEHDKFVKYHNMGAIHREYVRKILYIPHNNSIIASSGDNRNSLIITNINKLKKPYIFRLYKGCECFDYSKALNILITGGADYLARIWNPYVTQKNIAILEGHHAAVIDIKINERLAQCYTLSQDAMVKAWDLKEFFCLQTIPIRFPTTLGGKKPTFAPFAMDLYLNKLTNNTETSLPGGLVLACNDYLCLMKLGHDISKDGSLTETHTAPISCAVYNPKLKQLITCADNSSIGAWDIESGRKAYFIVDAHDGEEITCVSIDRSCRKLATGARNGVIKIWNTANGQNLLILPSVQDAEITGILFFDKGIITVGWSRKIVKYPDIISELVVPKADLSWRGSQTHRDDILCLEHLLPISNIMCTASYDGEINVWSIDTEKLVMCLRKGPTTELRRSPSNYRRSSSRYSIARGPVPVDKLLFLRHRAKENMKLGVLISSEGGNLYCWSLYGERKNMGMFYGPSKPGESILAMCTDATNRYLICGDTHGEMRVWNIENYCCSTTSPVLFDSTSPPLIHFWQAHISPIIFCEWTDYKGSGDFILTGSTDHTAHLWTINGEEIGIFGQRQQWDIELLLSSRITNDDEQIGEKSENNNENDQNDIKLTTTDKINYLQVPEIAINKDVGDKRPLSSTSQNSDRVSGLGLPIERGLNQQKLQRQERRHRFSGIDGRHLTKGGVCCTPFALLSTLDIDDAISNINYSSFQPKSIVIEELYMGNKNDLPSTTNLSSKNRLVLPSIISRQRTSSSFASNITSTPGTPFDVDTNNRFPLSSRQTTFMKSISEIS